MDSTQPYMYTGPGLIPRLSWNEAQLIYSLLRLIFRLEQDKRICHREVELKSGEHSQLVRELPVYYSILQYVTVYYCILQYITVYCNTTMP